MKEQETPQRREEKAVQALISAALHVSEDAVRAEEIRPYLSKSVVLSADEEAALKRKASRPLAASPSVVSSSETETADKAAFMALHRKQPGQGFSAKTEEEVRRKREELLEKLRKKKGSG